MGKYRQICYTRYGILRIPILSFFMRFFLLDSAKEYYVCVGRFFKPRMTDAGPGRFLSGADFLPEWNRLLRKFGNYEE